MTSRIFPRACSQLFFSAISCLLLVAGVVLGAAGSAEAESVKIGYVNEDKIVAGYEAWTKAEEQFQNELKAWQAEAEKMQQGYVDDSLEFEKQRLILSADKRSERQAQVAAKRSALDAFTKDIFGPNGQAERKNNALRKPLIDNINAAIAKVAQENNFDLILNSDAVAYGAPALDVSDKVVAALQKQ